MEYDYHLVLGGPSLKAVRTFTAECDAADRELEAFAKRFGATGWLSARSLLGLTFAGSPPEGWVPCKGHPKAFHPDRKTKEGRALAREMSAIGFPDWGRFGQALGVKGPFGMIVTDSPARGHGFLMKAPDFEKIGDATVIRVPLGRQSLDRDGGGPFVPPPETRRLKKSEYWAMKEAAEEKSGCETGKEE
jgi:hypothetical protein